MDNKLHDKFLFFDGNWENGSPNFFLDWTTDKILIALPTIYPSLNKSLNISSNYAVVYNDNHKNTSSIIFNSELYRGRLCNYNNIIDFIKKKSIDDFFCFFDTHTISEEKFIEKYNAYMQESAHNFVTSLKQTQNLKEDTFKIKNNIKA